MFSFGFFFQLLVSVTKVEKFFVIINMIVNTSEDQVVDFNVFNKDLY